METGSNRTDTQELLKELDKENGEREPSQRFDFKRFQEKFSKTKIPIKAMDEFSSAIFFSTISL